MVKYRRIYRHLSLCLALLLFVSSSGMSLDMHFCGDQLQRINAFGKAKTCAEVQASHAACQAKAKSCCSTKRQAKQHCSSTTHSKNCCSNSSIDLDYQFDSIIDGSILKETSIEFSKILFTHAEPYETKVNSNKKTLHHHNYKPPNLLEDKVVSFGNFRL
jgi:hypothetical protein